MADPQQTVNASDLQEPGTVASEDLTPLPSVPAPSSNVGMFSEAGKQLATTGKGLKDLLTVPVPSMADAAKMGLQGAYEGFVASPMRELLGQAQPGKSAISAPRTPVERLTGAVDTFMGGDPGAGRVNYLQGNTGAGLADFLTVPALTLGAGELARGLSKVIPRAAETESQMAKRAANLTNSLGIGKTAKADYPAEFKAALPELDKTVLQGGIDPRRLTMPDFYKVVADTFGRTERDFNNRLGPIANQQVMPQQVIDELRSYKVQNPLRPDDIARNRAIDAEIANFQKPLTVGQLNEQRMLARDRLSAFYKMNPSAQGSKMGSDVSMAIDHAIEDATKNLVYDKLQSTYANEVPTNYFRDLKRTQSALYNITDELKGRLNALSNDQARDFLDRLRPHSYMSSGGHVGMAIGGLSDALFPEARQAAKNVQKGLTPAAQKTGLPRVLTSAPSFVRHQQPSLAPNEE